MNASLDFRLERNVARPIVLALSGGGDSLALLLIAKTWADGAGRRIAAVTVDHGLQAAGADWARWCQARCHNLGVEHLTRTWLGDKPRAGLAAAARQARHALIAEAARALGARVVLMGHTADDRLEAELMAAEGSSVTQPREWSPSPVWPHGRGAFVHRPLLNARRASLRAALTEAGEDWIDDPGNRDPAQTRARARAALQGCAAPGPAAPGPGAGSLWNHVTAVPGGGLRLNAEAAARAPGTALVTLLGAALICASGAPRPARGRRLWRIAGRIAQGFAPGEGFVATLAGARIALDGDDLAISREAGDLRRVEADDLDLPLGRPVVWDGRFELTARQTGLSARALGGVARRLPAAQRRGLSAIAPALRGALPAIVSGEAVTCPCLDPNSPVVVRNLVLDRLAGACGRIQTEADIGRVAKPAPAS